MSAEKGMKTQDLLLLALIIGGIWWLNKGKKSGVQARKSAGGGGGGGLSSGSLDTSGTAIQPASETSVDVNISQGEGLPSQMDCIKNPTLFGCDSVLPTLAQDDAQAEDDGRETYAGEGMDEGGDGVQSGGHDGETSGQGDGGIEVVGGGDLGSHGDTTVDTHGDVVSTTTGWTPPKRFQQGLDKVVPVKKPAPKRFDGYSMEEVSEERTRGIKDKYDFDGEYGTFNDDSF